MLTLTATAPDIPPEPFTIKLDQTVSGLVGTGFKTISDLQPDPALAREFRITDYGDGTITQLDQVNCSDGATCQVLYDDTNANTKIGWIMTGFGLADLHAH